MAEIFTDQDSNERVRPGALAQAAMREYVTKQNEALQYIVTPDSAATVALLRLNLSLIASGHSIDDD